MKRYSLNKWVVQRDDGLYTGLCLADSRQDAEDCMDELGIEGELMTREDYEANTPEGQEEKTIKEARKARNEANEQEEKDRIAGARARNKARRAAGRP